MDFGRPHDKSESVTTRSNIRVLPVPPSDESSDVLQRIDTLLVETANTATVDLFHRQRPVDEQGDADASRTACASWYPEHGVARSSLIGADSLVVIFESFDNLNFAYATPGAIFNNRNGHFHHDDFLGRPFGCKIRARNNGGLGFVYLLRPTAELWTRSLNHRTQIIHELDASVIVFQLNLRPGMVVCESGTGSGAMSHAILRTIAPGGRLHTFEFNSTRVEAAREEFKNNRVDHLVTVRHVDVCGDAGFSVVGEDRADAVFLDLPEPWLAVPHAAHVLKGNARLGSYSPCVEQSQKTIQVLKAHGFHSIKTMEVRLREHYVDDVTLEMPPTERLKERAKSAAWNHTMLTGCTNSAAAAAAATVEEGDKTETISSVATTTPTTAEQDNATATATTTNGDTTTSQDEVKPPPAKKRMMLCARPFGTMRGHSAFLTFATSAYKS